MPTSNPGNVEGVARGIYPPIAVIGAEAVGGAQFVKVDVRFVATNVVGDDRVVPRLRRPAKERIHLYHNPARDGGGAGGGVAREMVAPDLHTARAEKPRSEARRVG